MQSGVAVNLLTVDFSTSIFRGKKLRIYAIYMACDSQYCRYRYKSEPNQSRCKFLLDQDVINGKTCLAGTKGPFPSKYAIHCNLCSQHMRYISLSKKKRKKKEVHSACPAM
jgi:hypothetical protein